MTNELRVKLTRYANSVAGNIARRGATAEDEQYINAEFRKDKSEIVEELDKLCGPSTYKLIFVPGWSTLGCVFDVYVEFTELKYATLYRMKT